MSIGKFCHRQVITAQRDDSVLEAAKLMRQHHVGDVLVIEAHNGRNIPVGIVTDRDLVVEIMAPELAPETITVGDIMVEEIAVIEQSVGVFEAIQNMRIKGIRRLPVVDKSGGLVGIITFDDLLALLAEELGTLVKAVAREQQKEVNSRR
ncbi:MAG: CBS domain-containing protein [Methylophilaceae bacterium]|nr:CBS domain-containing protein [Methylophilaceae bacterium]